MKTVFDKLHGNAIGYTMYNVSIDNLLDNYIVDIIDCLLSLTTTHFLYNKVTITQTVSPFCSTTYI